MREPDVVGAGARVDGDQPVRLGFGERVIGREALDLRQPQGLCESEQFDGGAELAGEPLDPAADELDQGGGHRRLARQPPQAPLGDEAAAADRAEYELAHVQRVALAAIEHPALRRLLDRAPEGALDERPHGVVAEPPELQALRPAVLPQRGDRVRAGLAGADRRDHEDPGARRQVQHERGRRRIEQLRVVHAEDDRAPGRPIAQGLRGLAQQFERLLGAHGRGQEPGEGAERDQRGAPGRLHPLAHRPRALGTGQSLAPEPRLASAGLGADDDAAATVVARLRDRRQLGVPADERPLERRRLVHESELYGPLLTL